MVVGGHKYVSHEKFELQSPRLKCTRQSTELILEKSVDVHGFCD